MNIKFDYCKCIRIYEKAHLRPVEKKNINKLPSVGVIMGLSSNRAVVGAVVVEVEVLGRSTVPEGVVTTTTLGGVMAT